MLTRSVYRAFKNSSRKEGLDQRIGRPTKDRDRASAACRTNSSVSQECAADRGPPRRSALSHSRQGNSSTADRPVRSGSVFADTQDTAGAGPSAPSATQTGRSKMQRSEEHTSELQSRQYLVCRLLLEK